MAGRRSQGVNSSCDSVARARGPCGAGAGPGAPGGPGCAGKARGVPGASGGAGGSAQTHAIQPSYMRHRFSALVASVIM